MRSIRVRVMHRRPHRVVHQSHMLGEFHRVFKKNRTETSGRTVRTCAR